MISKVSTLKMTHDEWLSERKRGIGGSDAGAILGLNPYKSAFEVFADKIGLTEPKPDNEAMRQGRDLEEYVAQRFSEQTGKKVHKVNSILYNSEYPFAFANIDRAVQGEKAGLECKTTKCLSMKRYKNGDYPEEYYCQCMHYMMVTGYSKWYLAVLIYGTELKIFEIARDEEEISALYEAEYQFWAKHVMKAIPPLPNGSKSVDRVIATMYPQSDCHGITLEPVSEDLKRLKEIKTLITEYDRERRRLEQNIKLYMKDCEEGVTSEFQVIWRTQKRSGFDVDSVIKDFVPEGTDLSKYWRTTECRPFRVKEI